MEDQIKEIYADQIDDPETPMRTDIDRVGILELAESIAREGLINPITVRPRQGRFEVVAGHRRFMACKAAGIVRIPCVVRDLSDERAAEVMAHENLHREDVDVVDQAINVGRLLSGDDANVDVVARRLNRSVAWVRSRLEILSYPDYFLPPLKRGVLKLGVASWLAQIEDDAWRRQYLDVAVNQGMSELQARYLHDQWKMGVIPPSDSILPPTEELRGGEPPAARATCAACGMLAIDPNLRNVFIHKECPDPSSSPPQQIDRAGGASI